jgi:hypothetical protein
MCAVRQVTVFRDCNHRSLCVASQQKSADGSYSATYKAERDGKQGTALLSKCANPICSVPFRRLSEGKLFVVEARRRGGVECFWLCDNCSLSLKVEFSSTRGVVIRSERAGIADSISKPMLPSERSIDRILAGFSTAG